MIYLLLAILCSSSIALLFKYTETRGLNRYAVTTTNYFTASIVGLFMVISNLLLNNHSLVPSIWSITEEFNEVVIRNKGIFTESATVSWAIILGVITGIFYFACFICYQESVKQNGAALSGTFGRLGILIPMLFSIIIWDEQPTFLQIAGIVLSLISIIIVNISYKEKETKGFNLLLIVLFLLGGLGDFHNKLFQKYAILIYKDLFLFSIFFTAFLLSLYFTFRSKNRVSGKDIIFGFLVGIPNLFSSYFLILALNTVATAIAFPAYSAGSILFINIGGILIYKEKLSIKSKIAVALIVVSLLLINT
jgi:multidrug transporter EmrE-like cation transporter